MDAVTEAGVVVSAPAAALALTAYFALLIGIDVPLAPFVWRAGSARMASLPLEDRSPTPR